ncbi:hypothetical protein ACOMHN_049103 [Nucella lapillus]
MSREATSRTTLATKAEEAAHQVNTRDLYTTTMSSGKFSNAERPVKGKGERTILGEKGMGWNNQISS